MIECKADRHHSAGERCRDKQRLNKREARDAAHRGDQLHVPPTHAAGEMKQKKDQTATQSGCRCCA